jgi:hypothetical protein
MTIEEFNNTRFGVGMKCLYKGKEYDIYQVDFEECLLGIWISGPYQYFDWVRCENINLVNN